MLENTGLYKKFNVTRADGQPDKPNAAYFVLDVVNDPCALAALRAYREAAGYTFPALAVALYQLELDLIRADYTSPAVQALRTPRS